ncbi:MAG: ABC transporter ATP-binding protein [Alphaproteobacteria bacterium]|nr:ABC transporter ATP-binding protein [Alphaproteobacteria bacterium]
MPADAVLSVRGLAVDFATRRRTVRAVSEVAFDLRPGRTLGLVGESGSGKSVTSLALMRLLAQPAGRIGAGSILLRTPDGVLDLARLPEPAMRRVRGRRVAMVFQEPMTSLNPMLPIGEQIAEVARLHLGRGRADAARDAVALLDRVGIPAAASRAQSYPHELSGGMRQRAMIAIALACRPSVMIADEPTTALDVTIQAQVLTLIRELQDETRMAVLFITHNLGVVAEVADEVAVMYGGQFVETGMVAEVLARPAHPYTRALLESLPPAIGSAVPLRRRLHAIPGSVVDLAAPPPGCRFGPRCERHVAACDAAPVALDPLAPGRAVRCIRARETA